MSEKQSKPFASLFELVILALIIVPGFWGLKYFYETSSFGSFLAYSSVVNQNTIDINSNNLGSYTTTIIQLYNHSLIMVFILPIVTAVAVSLFANFILVRRVNNLETELKEIKEKIDA